jgi:hypothetical protein
MKEAISLCGFLPHSSRVYVLELTTVFLNGAMEKAFPKSISNFSST